jgi:hypothetical protein
MTPAQQARILGLRANLLVRGRSAVTDTAEKLVVLVEDIQELPDPDKPVQTELCIYTTITALAGSVRDPRAIGSFKEADGRGHRVIEYLETRGDMVTLKWRCEADRQ